MDTPNTDQEIFDGAIENFFRYNPANPYWALIALYLRKIHRLLPVEAYADSHTLAQALSFDARLQEIYRVMEAESGAKSGSGACSIVPDPFHWEKEAYSGLACALLTVDDRWFQKEFHSLFLRTVQRCFFKIRYDIHTQPPELNRLIRHFIPDSVRKVYAPFAGIASDVTALPAGVTYVGEDTDPLVAAIGNLQLMASGVEGRILVESSFNDRDFDADLILSTPPFCMPVKLDGIPASSKYGRSLDAEDFLLTKCMLSKKAGIITVGAAFNASPRFRECRQRLVEEDYIEAVISLPRNIFYSTGVKTCLYVINPRHEGKGTVRMIDAGELFEGKRWNVTLQADEVIALAGRDCAKSQDISIDVIRGNRYILSPELYLRPEIELPVGADLVSLRELGHFARLQALSPSSGVHEGRLLNMQGKDSQNAVKIYRASAEFNIEPLPRQYCKMEEEGVVIPIYLKRKPIVADNEGEPLYTTPLWRPFIIRDKNRILPQYLAIQMSQPYFEKQIAGSAVYVPTSMLLGASVVVPSLESQRKEIDRYQEDLLRQLGLDIEKEKANGREELLREIRLRRHTLLNKFFQISSNSKLLEYFLADYEGKDFNAETLVSDMPEITLRQLVSRNARTLDQIRELMKNLVEIDDVPAETEATDIAAFCREFEVSFHTGGEFEIFYVEIENMNGEKDEDDSTDRGPGKPLYVRMSRKDLETVFENIVVNARRHGFADLDNPSIPAGSKPRNYHVRIELTFPEPGDDSVVIRFLNNGKRLPEGMPREDVFAWGRNRGDAYGSGLGGYHIARIVRSRGGTVDVFNLENDENGFNLAYEVRLPLAFPEI